MPLYGDSPRYQPWETPEAQAELSQYRTVTPQGARFLRPEHRDNAAFYVDYDRGDFQDPNPPNERQLGAIREKKLGDYLNAGIAGAFMIPDAVSQYQEGFVEPKLRKMVPKSGWAKAAYGANYLFDFINRVQPALSKWNRTMHSKRASTLDKALALGELAFVPAKTVASVRTGTAMDRVQSYLPEYLGGKYENESDRDYELRTGNNLNSELSTAIQSGLVNEGSRMMTDRELYDVIRAGKHKNAPKILPNGETTRQQISYNVTAF